jgi:uncharacterized membrane protein
MVLAGVVALVVLRVTAAVVLGFRSYFPADFDSDFLQGRESYFYGPYQGAFYTHILSGPLSLILGLILLSDRIRTSYPAAHRMLGRVQGVDVLFVVCPSGLWMAWYAASGPVAAASFGLLAIVTAACTAMGWRAAVSGQYGLHKRWMNRSFVLLCSAVVLRVVGGLGAVLQVQASWYDPAASWACWMIPLVAFEAKGIWRFARSRRALGPVMADPRSATRDCDLTLMKSPVEPSQSINGSAAHPAAAGPEPRRVRAPGNPRNA